MVNLLKSLEEGNVDDGRASPDSDGRASPEMEQQQQQQHQKQQQNNKWARQTVGSTNASAVQSPMYSPTPPKQTKLVTHYDCPALTQPKLTDKPNKLNKPNCLPLQLQP
jgi:hypothetical protein